LTPRQEATRRVYWCIRRCDGASERELAEMTGLQRRSVNNYLRELERDGIAWKEGRYWYAR
jgi:transposase